jgi:propanediol dehydratase large subunit
VSDAVGRFRFMDQARVNLDGFAVENIELGLTAFSSPYDPIPSITIEQGRVTELDGVAEADFDAMDEFIARHGIDITVAEEAMALSDVAFARLLVDPFTPRSEVVRLSAGTTPAKLARVLSLLQPSELMMAMTKMPRRAIKHTSPTAKTILCYSPPMRQPPRPLAFARSKRRCQSLMMHPAMPWPA